MINAHCARTAAAATARCIRVNSHNNPIRSYTKLSTKSSMISMSWLRCCSRGTMLHDEITTNALERGGWI